MAGYYHERGADGILDPLYSKAMVVEYEGQRAAFVVLDLIAVTRWITDEARVQVEQATGIKGDHVMISATHAHTGPELARRGKRSADMGSQSAACIAYTESLPNLIARSVRLASDRLQPSTLSVAKGQCDGLTFNRRFFMKDGSTGWNPGKLNPNVMMPAGPSDSDLALLYVEQPGASTPAQAIATYVNFSMHPDTTGGSKFSADWPGALSRILASYHGTNHFSMVANGTCGNLNHIDTSWGWPQGGPGEQNRIGTILGAAVFQTYKSLKPASAGAIRARSGRVSLDLPEVTEAQVAEARQTVESTKNDHGANFMKLVRAYRALDVAARNGKPQEVEVQVISLGQDIAWVGLPGEIFVELGMALKRQSPFAHTFLVELANENVGYVPDRRSFAEGNYEPESARCAPGSGEKMIEFAARMLKELKESNR
jgi:neutral ceramidase